MNYILGRDVRGEKTELCDFVPQIIARRKLLVMLMYHFLMELNQFDDFSKSVSSIRLNANFFYSTIFLAHIISRSLNISRSRIFERFAKVWQRVFTSKKKISQDL